MEDIDSQDWCPIFMETDELCNFNNSPTFPELEPQQSLQLSTVTTPDSPFNNNDPSTIAESNRLKTIALLRKHNSKQEKTKKKQILCKPSSCIILDANFLDEASKKGYIFEDDVMNYILNYGSDEFKRALYRRIVNAQETDAEIDNFWSTHKQLFGNWVYYKDGEKTKIIKTDNTNFKYPIFTEAELERMSTHPTYSKYVAEIRQRQQASNSNVVQTPRDEKVHASKIRGLVDRILVPPRNKRKQLLRARECDSSAVYETALNVPSDTPQSTSQDNKSQQLLSDEDFQNITTDLKEKTGDITEAFNNITTDEYQTMVDDVMESIDDSLDNKHFKIQVLDSEVLPSNYGFKSNLVYTDVDLTQTLNVNDCFLDQDDKKDLVLDYQNGDWFNDEPLNLSCPKFVNREMPVSYCDRIQSTGECVEMETSINTIESIPIALTTDIAFEDVKVEIRPNHKCCYEILCEKMTTIMNDSSLTNERAHEILSCDQHKATTPDVLIFLSKLMKTRYVENKEQQKMGPVVNRKENQKIDPLLSESLKNVSEDEIKPVENVSTEQKIETHVKKRRSNEVNKLMTSWKNSTPSSVNHRPLTRSFFEHVQNTTPRALTRLLLKQKLLEKKTSQTEVRKEKKMSKRRTSSSDSNITRYHIRNLFRNPKSPKKRTRRGKKKGDKF